MTIYIVMREDDYGDSYGSTYEITAAFLSPIKAEKYIEDQQFPSIYYIEECELIE